MRRSPVVDVYNQIIADLHTAEAKLAGVSKPIPNSHPEAYPRRGHVRKGAATLLLAKVYNTMGSGSLSSADITVPITITRMTNGDIVRNEQTFTKNKVDGYDFNPLVAYDSAKNVALRLINAKEYQMMSYANTWNNVNYGGSEFVFALETDTANGNAYTTIFHSFCSPPGLLGKGWLQYTKDLYYMYDPADERAKYGIAHEYASYQKPDKSYMRLCFPIEDSLAYRLKYGAGNVDIGYNLNYCFLMKWYPGNSANPNVTLQENYPTIDRHKQNYPLLRYTEAFLILAEAENEINGASTLAYDALDFVRSYRYSTSGYEVNRTMNQQQLRSFIQDERTREFIGEGYGRFDLIRWGIYLQVMNAIDHRDPRLNTSSGRISKTREQKHLLMPPPTIELDNNLLFGPTNTGW
jgi:hypothetical protein